MAFENGLPKPMIPEKFKSRKFLMALGAALVALGSALTGALTWEQAIQAVVAAVIAFIVGEGAVDAARAFKTG